MKLNETRKIIDDIDKKIAILLNERFNIVKEIKQIKEKQNIEIFDLKREQEVINNNKVYILNEFQEQFIEIYQTIIKVSKEIQKRWKNMV